MKKGDKVIITECEEKRELLNSDLIDFTGRIGTLMEYYGSDHNRIAISILFDENPVPTITNRPYFLYPVKIKKLTTF